MSNASCMLCDTRLVNSATNDRGRKRHMFKLQCRMLSHSIIYNINIKDHVVPGVCSTRYSNIS